VSTIVQRTRMSLFLSLFIVLGSGIAGLMMNLFVFTSLFLNAPVAYHLFAPFSMSRILWLMSRRSYYWADLNPSDEVSVAIGMLFVDGLLYFVLALYFDLVFPKEYGVTRPALFPIYDTISFIRVKVLGGKSKTEQLLERQRLTANSSDDVYPGEDTDVSNERLAVKQGTIPEDSPIKIMNLRKVFGNRKVAVDDVTLHMETDQCFGLLGPNGAGKSTVISMLTGLYGPTAGVGIVNNYDIYTQMNQIHNSIGVCPQFDVLWPRLTVQEHLLFYARLKGITGKKAFTVAARAARAVELSGKAYKRFAGKLSGGMQRRLSLAISFIGNPDVVFLDEPTTGLDVETRSSIHKLIDAQKQNRCIVLTTHSMEEADTLCNRIGIMTHGLLKIIGDNLHLKNKYGQGYKLDITFETGKGDVANAYVLNLYPQATVASEFGESRIYEIPKTSTKLSELFQKMHNRDRGSSGIKEFSVRMTSLNEVFLQIAKASEAEYGTA